MKPFLSPAILMVFLLLFTREAICQANSLDKDTTSGPDHLLWYSGKKKNDSTLITTSGSVVIYKGRKNEVTVQPPAQDDPFKPILDELNKTDQLEQEVKKQFLTGKDAVANYAIYAAAVRNYEHETETFKKVTANSLSLPQESLAEREAANQQFVQRMLTKNCPDWQIVYEQVMKYMKQHQGEKSYDLPAPPYLDYEHCWECDTSKQRIFDDEFKFYDSSLFAEEDKQLKDAEDLMHSFAMLGVGEPYQVNPINPNDQETTKMMIDLFGGSHTTACSWMNEANVELPKAIDFLGYRILDKAAQLFKKYNSNFHYLRAVVHIYLEASRRRIMLTGVTNLEDAPLRQIGRSEERRVGKECRSRWSP